MTEKTTAFIVPAGTMKEDGTYFTRDTFIDRSRDLRDEIAIAALQALIERHSGSQDRETIVNAAWYYADAMLAQRGKG